MLHIKSVMKPKFSEALLIIIAIISFTSVSIVKYQVTPHIPILFSLLLLIIYGLFKNIKYKDIEGGLIEGASSGMSAVFLFFFIGILVSSWIMSGTIPTLIYLGFQIIT